MKHLANFVYALLAGISISIGGLIFLQQDSKVLGALLFAVGLFTICTFGLNLFTGKACYLFENKPGTYIPFLLLVWVGNFLGCFLSSRIIMLTRLSDALVASAQKLADTKLNDSLLSLFVLALFCNILIFVAVDGFKNNHHEVGKYLGLLFGVVVFITCGFEHSVADMFYFCMAGAFTGKMLLCVVVISLGNVVGGCIIPVCRMFYKKVMA